MKLLLWQLLLLTILFLQMWNYDDGRLTQVLLLLVLMLTGMIFVDYEPSGLLWFLLNFWRWFLFWWWTCLELFLSKDLIKSIPFLVDSIV